MRQKTAPSAFNLNTSPVKATTVRVWLAPKAQGKMGAIATHGWPLCVVRSLLTSNPKHVWEFRTLPHGGFLAWQDNAELAVYQDNVNYIKTMIYIITK
jgi:hypothetical protein